jgi:glycosyltransferase involved in cell wall biosynthesis
MSRLLVTYLYCNLGGVATVIKQRLPALRGHGLEVHGLFRKDNGGAPDLKKAGIGQVRIAGTGFPIELEKAAASGAYEAIVIFDDPEALKIAVQFTTPVIYEIHTPIEDVLLKNEPAVLAQCSRIIVPSRWSRDWVLSYFPEVSAQQISVCPNIVDPRPFVAPPAPYPIFQPRELLWVGKVAKYKNWREALRIGHVLVRRGVISRITFVTGGSLLQDSSIDLLTEAASLNMTTCLRWLHNLPYWAIVAAYKNAAERSGVLLSCSLSESFCYVVHEAMRAGLPVVSTSVGAVSDVVEHGVTGFLYDAGDYMTAADLVERCFDKHRQRRTEAAGDLLERHFSPERLEDTYLQVIHDAVRHTAVA